MLEVSKTASCPILYSWACQKLKFGLKGISAFVAFYKNSDSMKQIPKILFFIKIIFNYKIHFYKYLSVNLLATNR